MASNPLRTDPTRTVTLRRKFQVEMTKRFNSLKVAIRKLVIDDDVFGLKQSIQPFATLQEVQAWRFQSDSDKIKSFNRWFKTQIDEKILSVDSLTNKPWTSLYVDSAYKQGMMRAYIDTRKELLQETKDYLGGSREEFLRSAFAAPETISKLQFLGTTAYEELNGITAAMSQQISRTLALGIAQGEGPAAIARRLSQTIDKITRTRANVLARTEIIAAHAEGQLDSFERLGIEEVGVLAEWSTAGDDRVCFPKDTMISTKNGLKPIQCIEKDEFVYTRKGLRKVLLKTERCYQDDLVSIKANGTIYLRCTKDHLVFVQDYGFIVASDLQVGQLMQTKNNEPIFIEGIFINKIERGISVYNLEIANEPEFYANGILVHNCPLCASLNGVVMTIKEARGLIPRHANCRCAWTAILPSKVKSQRERLAKKIGLSLKAELPKSAPTKTIAAAKRRSTWAGKRFSS